MHKPMAFRSTMWVAALVTAAATVYALHESYDTLNLSVVERAARDYRGSPPLDK